MLFTPKAMPRQIHWPTTISRRQLLNLAPLSVTSFALAACRGAKTYKSSLTLAHAQAQKITQTPSCGNASTTLTQTPGPFYRPNSPQRNSLTDSDTPGQRIVLTGRVLTKDCQPVFNGLVDIWHADPQGEYDNRGNRFRGHQFTDSQGNYRMETVLPGIYPGRTRHIHVRVQGNANPLLTTQLYFPDEPLNSDDFLFQPALLVARSDNSDRAGESSEDNALNFVFDFILG